MVLDSAGHAKPVSFLQALSPRHQLEGTASYNFWTLLLIVLLTPPETIDPVTLGLAQFAKHIPEVAPIMILSHHTYKRQVTCQWQPTSQIHSASGYPWAFEQPDPLRDEDFDKDQRSYMQSHLWPKALV
ncbi:hypothetical protein F4774DRAFT_405618 [Daldinia eschscholtzii]|nr:hypothetical protein F4774DRAFT_405618 [Daldinia eschscholtzii]